MGIWSDNFGDGNSFTESVANTFTPKDGASYVSGTLTYDDGAKAGKTVTQNDDGSYGNDGQGNSVYTGSGNNVKTNATLNADGTVTEYVPKGTAPEFGLDDAALGILSPLSLIPKALGKFTSWTMGIDPKTNSSKDVNGRMVYTKPEVDNVPGLTYSYNFLGQPYEVEIIDGKVVDANSIVKDENGKKEGDTGFDPSTAKSGYDRKFAEAEGEGDDGALKELQKYEEDNANEEGEISDGMITSAAVLQMAKDAGVTLNQADMVAIAADPEKFLSDRKLTLSDIITEIDPDAEGTELDPAKDAYKLGDDPSYTATQTGATSLVGDETKPDAATYTADTNVITNAMLMDAQTGTVSDEAQVNAEDYTIDMVGAATGVNKDGTTSVLGEALNDFETQSISQIIDTTTIAGKLLAQKLGEGNYTDSKATTLGQMKIISDEFKDSNGNPVIPPWAQSLARDANKSIAFTGISGTAAIATLSNAIMEATLGIAESDAKFFQTLTTKNLDNRQEAIINKASVLANLEVANLDARSAAAVQNAKSFLEMDLTNLSNEQQAEKVNKEAYIQALFENTKAENASRLFTAESENEINKFYSELQVAIERHNSSETNTLAKFNAGEMNDAAEFNGEIKTIREKFLSEMQYNIDVSNVKWRQTVETTNNANEVEAHTTDVKNGLDLSQEALNNIWDSSDNLLDYIWKTTDSDQERELRLLIAQMDAQSGKSSGGGFLSGLFTLGGAYLGTKTGSGWLTKIFDSDIRLKENVQHYDTLKGINFYTWDWNAEGVRIGADKHPTFGVIAQEVQKTHPEAVVEGPDGYLRVNYGVINNDI